MLFGLLFWVVDPNELLATLLRADALLVAALCGVAVVWLFLGALNVWVLLRCRSTIPLLSFTEVYVMSWSMGLLIPGQLGDATQILLLRRHSVAVASSAAAYTVDKIISLCTLGLIGAYGVARFSIAVSPITALAVSATAAILFACAIFLVIKLVPGFRLLQRVREFLKSISTEIAFFRVRPDLISLNALISIVKWLVMAHMYYTVFAALSVAISFESAATIPVVSSLVAYIPITVSGIGTTEWTAVGLFRTVGIAPFDVVGAYLVMRAVLISCAAAMLIVGRLSRRARSH
ncbi:MAG: flippase-like domain-containing protein [Gammaproteobacteria bacterium]|nr:flippase-like domain-containing protein [Gammaproteobacteria bacterium]